jgi:diguanylate cyclase (GGDEF)-like protein/PAS domain S-box-containing protein
MELAPVPREPEEPFVPDLSEGAEAGLYLSLFELMNEGLIITSDETILEVNSAVCRLMERSYRDLAGQPLSTLFPSERAFLNARGALFIQGEMRGSLRVKLGGGRERDLAYVAAARIRPGVHAIILSPDPVTGLGADAPRTADTVWPQLAAAIDQPVLVIDGRERIVAANAPARRRFPDAGQLTGSPLSSICRLREPERSHGPVVVEPADGAAPIRARLLSGPEDGWRILILGAANPAAPPPASAPVEARAERSFRQAPLPMLVVRERDQQIVAVNQAAERAYGHSRQSLLGQPLERVRRASPDKAPLAPGLWYWLGADGPFAAETLAQRLEGDRGEWLLIHDAPGMAWPPALSAGLGGFMDSPQAMLLSGPDQCISAANPAFEALTGHGAADLVGARLETLAGGRHDEAFFARMHESLSSTGAWQGELWLRRPDGEARPEWLALNAVRNAHGELIAFVGLITDLGTRRQAQARAEFLAGHDALTGLPNQRFIEARIEDTLAEAGRARQHLALVCLDIDGFRTTNENFGHRVGDTVLQQLAGRLQQCSPRVETARMGSDQFCLLISGIDLISEIDREVERIRAVFSTPIAAQGHPHTISACLGVAIFPADGQDFGTLWGHAVNAMRNARLEGPGSCHFHAAALNTASLERMAIERALGNAVQQGAVQVHFQPVCDARTGAILAAEAMLRWMHPDLGALRPSQFMPIAEGCGLDVDIGFESLRVACQTAAEWHHAGMPVRVAVHATANMLVHERLVETVSSALSEAGLPAAALELNLPASSLAPPGDALTRHLFAIDSLGVRIAVSEAGSEPLPLGGLASLPVHMVKLDRELVRDCLHASRSRQLKATLAAAAALSLEVQAVGVESAEQAEALAALGCLRQQGHLYAVPRPADEFAQML